MLPLSLYTGQPNGAQGQRTEALPGKEPACEHSSAVSDSWHLAPLVLCSEPAAYLGSEFRHLPAVSLESHPAKPQELSSSRQKLTVDMWSC